MRRWLWCPMFCKMFQNGEGMGRYLSLRCLSFSKQIVLQSRNSIQVFSSAPAGKSHPVFLEIMSILQDLFNLVVQTSTPQVILIRRSEMIVVWYSRHGSSGSLSLSLSGLYEVNRKVMEKQEPSQRSRAKTHTHYVGLSIQTHTGILSETRHIRGHTCTRGIAI